MGDRLTIISELHRATQRDYLARMIDEKAACMRIARKFERDFWDGDRRFGYGGYTYDGRWKPVAEKLIECYGLVENSKILDVGCGKGFLLYEIKKLLPQADVTGLDISNYALTHAKPEIREYLFQQAAQKPLGFEDGSFDLVISLTTLHNLPIYGLKKALMEIERVGRQKYIVVESYRSEKELFNLQCWALTCEAFFSPDEWEWIFAEFGFTGDYEYIFFE